MGKNPLSSLIVIIKVRFNFFSFFGPSRTYRAEIGDQVAQFFLKGATSLSQARSLLFSISERPPRHIGPKTGDLSLEFSFLSYLDCQCSSAASV